MDSASLLVAFHLQRGMAGVSRWPVVPAAAHGLLVRMSQQLLVRLLEPFFHRRILEWDCLANDPTRVDAVFIPYYAALDALPYVLDPAILDASSRHDAELAAFLARVQPWILSRSRQPRSRGCTARRGARQPRPATSSSGRHRGVGCLRRPTAPSPSGRRRPPPRRFDGRLRRAAPSGRAHARPATSRSSRRRV
ncbi:hypothetical protein C2845_PM07G12630 [Panicum miliaceum]|uniref:Uncharacterized protein n=1 Tax=Panicum miliaceum TaxID=4540 RepID=A0A3L6SR24_PANMI|nr:hypothetical protein C2845_PM07G12630 [Panicum miliaceum]